MTTSCRCDSNTREVLTWGHGRMDPDPQNIVTAQAADELFRLAGGSCTNLRLTDDGAAVEVRPNWERDAAIAGKVAETKHEARTRIISLEPSWTPRNHAEKQRNALMQVAEMQYRVFLLLNKKIDSSLTAQEQAELEALLAGLDALRSKKQKIDAIRTASDQVEADIAAAEVPGDVDVKRSPRWGGG